MTNIKKSLSENFKEFLESKTPKELQELWHELESYNNIGPKATELVKAIKKDKLTNYEWKLINKYHRVKLCNYCIHCKKGSYSKCMLLPNKNDNSINPNYYVCNKFKSSLIKMGGPQ